jgi:ABC-type xylose transport system permease subunit
MGLRSADGAPNWLLLAAAAQALEAIGLIVVIVANLIDLSDGRTLTRSNAVGVIVVEVIVAVGVAAIATAIARVRPWARTPAVMTQVFAIFLAIWLLDAHRLAWGLPTLIVALAGLAGLFAPTSLRALNRH